MISPIEKYLHQKCKLSVAKRDKGGNILLDKFGAPTYSVAKVVKCRKAKGTRSVATSTGFILQNTTVYITAIDASISVDDLIDDNVVVAVEEYVDALGRVIGYKSYV